MYFDIWNKSNSSFKTTFVNILYIFMTIKDMQVRYNKWLL